MLRHRVELNNHQNCPIIIAKGAISAALAVAVFLVGEIPIFIATCFNLQTMLHLKQEGSQNKDYGGFIFHTMEVNQKAIFYLICLRIQDLFVCSNLFVYYLSGKKYRRQLTNLLNRRESNQRGSYIDNNSFLMPRIAPSGPTRNFRKRAKKNSALSCTSSLASTPHHSTARIRCSTSVF